MCCLIRASSNTIAYRTDLKTPAILVMLLSGPMGKTHTHCLHVHGRPRVSVSITGLLKQVHTMLNGTDRTAAFAVCVNNFLPARMNVEEAFLLYESACRRKKDPRP